ncbi:LysR family transcriptional regulator [Acinetobacter nosocomialis]|uniref:LysR family transcriptional regulator n=1 Tax=Acinetobacter nosocomialis TaxID=106654 RepID=UPI0025A2C937|nr:LysR family transcriptional regulator [Acinetobacter nosocomialis]
MNTLPYSIDDLYWFVLIAEAGGLSSAARQYDIAKSTLSNRLVRLEDSLGVKLLQRNTNSSNLTDAGELFLREVGPIIHRLEGVTSELTNREIEPKGLIKLTASGTFGKLVILPLIAGFLRNYPQVSIEAELTDKRIDLISQGVDLAIRIGELNDSNLYAQKVGEVRRVLCASASYIKLYSLPHEPEQLMEHSFISQSRSSSKIRLTKNDKTRQFTIQSRLTVAPSDNLLAAVSAGLGIAPLAEIQISNFIKSGEIVRILPEWELPEENVYMITPSNRYRPLALRLLLDYFKENIPERIQFLKNNG